MAGRTRTLAALFAVCAVAAGCAARRPSVAAGEYPDLSAYEQARERLLRDERARRLSAALVLSPE